VIRLTASQQRVVNHNEGALLVVAGPGSGKTRVLTERIRRLLEDDVQHFRVLALTFTNKAANEMVERLQGVPDIYERAFIGTMHSFCTEVLANRGTSVGISGLPHIFDAFEDRRQVLQEAILDDPELRSEIESISVQKDRTARLNQWLRDIGEAKNALVVPEMVTDPHAQRIYRAYNQQLRASNAIDFDDLLLLTYQLFEQRPKVADFYRRQYKYICIDEAQDLNEAQYRVICALCGDSYNNVMLVGDPKQAIFTWNGADPKYLDAFAKTFEATTIQLDENFRSARLIVEAARKLDPTYSVDGILPIEGQLEVWECDDEQSEADSIVEELERLREDGHADIEGEITCDRVAIIGRNRFVFHAIEDKLRSSNIPYYKKLSAAGVRSESDTLGDVELALRILANPQDRLHLGILLQRWSIDTPPDEIYAAVHHEGLTGENLLKHVASLSPNSMDTLLDSIHAMGGTADTFRLLPGLAIVENASTSYDPEARALVLQDISEWRKHWNYYVRSERGAHSIQNFLSQVALGTTQQPREDGVALLTVHSAKGMEFDIVFLVSMTEGTFPDYRAVGSQLNEEQRNAFVAVTRSRRLLYATYPLEKVMPWGDTKRQRPSRYLTSLQDVLE
jgi:DNA helicase-2/ATP-dependent DNA helicase PcrA